jgi:hypothetical protein
MTIQDKIAALPLIPAPMKVTEFYTGWEVAMYWQDREDAVTARLDLALEVLRFTQCLCSVHVTCDRCAVLAACEGEKP